MNAEKKNYCLAIPEIGLGTFGSDRVSAEDVAGAVDGAVRAGYRMIDCAACYGNEAEIGEVLEKILKEGVVKREELFVASKVWNDMHRYVRKALTKTLTDLRLDYVDLYFIHWPFPNYHPPGCSVDERNPDSRPFSVEEFMDTYRQLEELYEEGLIRAIGVSNMTIPKFELTLPLMKVAPYACELELHPCFQQEELLAYVKAHGMVPVAYMPMGSPRRPDRDICEGDAVDLAEPALLKIAKDRGATPAEIALRWAKNRGTVPIPFSVHHYQENLDAMKLPALTDEEMAQMASLECGSRLVKGQVFLWEGAEDWRDLWDEDGTIAG